MARFPNKLSLIWETRWLSRSHKGAGKELWILWGQSWSAPAEEVHALLSRTALLGDSVFLEKSVWMSFKAARCWKIDLAVTYKEGRPSAFHGLNEWNGFKRFPNSKTWNFLLCLSFHPYIAPFIGKHSSSGLWPHWHRLRFLSPHPTHPGFFQRLKSCLLPASPGTRPPSNHGADNILHSHVGPHAHHGHVVIHNSPDQHTPSCRCVLPPRSPSLPVDSELSWEEVKVPRRALTAALKSTMASSEFFYQQALCNFLF